MPLSKESTTGNMIGGGFDVGVGSVPHDYIGIGADMGGAVPTTWDDAAYLNWYQSLPDFVKAKTTVSPTGELLLGGDMVATPGIFNPDFTLRGPAVAAPPVRTIDDDIRDFFATEPTAQEVFDAMQQYGVTPQQVIDAMGLDPVKAMADYNTFLNPPIIPTTTGPVTGGEPPSIQVSTGTGEIEETPVLGTGTFSTVQNVLNDVGRRVGEGLDKVFDILGIPRPDYTVIQPRAPGATVVWGQPSGSVFGRVGTTPGGNVVGVQTGIPALDVIIGKVSDILTGRATSVADVFGLEDLKTVVLETAKGELGIPDLNDPGEILKAVLDASNLTDEEKNKILVDTTKKDQGSGADRAVTKSDDVDRILSGGADRVITGNDDVDRILSGGADRVVTKSDDVDRILKTAGERTTDRNPDLDTLDDRASDFNNFISTLIGGGGLGLGVGAGGGALQVTDPLYAEIEYLYDMLDILPQNLRDEYSDEELVDMLSTLPKNPDTQKRGRR